MKRLLFLMMPLRGHVNPNLKLLEELSRRKVPILLFCDSAYRKLIYYENIQFFSYPEEILQFCHEVGPDANNRQQAANQYYSFLTDSTLTQLRSSEAIRQGNIFLNQYLEVINAFRPEIILSDSQITFGEPLFQYLNCPVIELNCSAYIPSLQKSRSFQKYYEDIVRKETTYSMTFDGLLNLQRNKTKQGRQDGYKKLYFAYHSPLLQDEFEMIPEHKSYLGFTLNPTICKETNTIYISRGTITNSYSNGLLEDTLGSIHQDNDKYRIRVSLGNNNHITHSRNKNLHIMNYANQIDELSRATLFITHGGITGVREAIFCETPMLVIPSSFPEYQVGSALVRYGAGLMAEERPINKEEIRNKCDDIMRNYERYLIGIRRIKNELNEYWNKTGIHQIIRKCEEL